jgi:hypothetical protein
MDLKSSAVKSPALDSHRRTQLNLKFRYGLVFLILQYMYGISFSKAEILYYTVKTV